MLAIALSIFVCLASTSAFGFANDIAAAAGPRLAAQQGETAIERELSVYLADDDIAGAMAFVEELADGGQIGEAKRRELEERIRQTMTERTIDYARKIREAIGASDLETMRDYNARLQRLIGGTGSKAIQADGSDEPEPVHGAEPPSDDIDAIAAFRANQDDIDDLVRRGEAAIADYNLTVAPTGADSALGMVDALMALGGNGEAAAGALGRKIMDAYEALIERDIARGLFDKARKFAERMGEVAGRAKLPTDRVAVLRARIEEAASAQ